MSARKAIWQSAKIFHSKDFAGSDWLQSLGLSFTTNWRIFQIWYWCEQYTGNRFMITVTIDLTMDILSQQHRKEIIFQERFVKIIRGKTWDRLLTNYLCRRSYTLQMWKDVKRYYRKLRGLNAQGNSYKKLQPFFKDFSRTTLDFQGPPTRNIISQIVQKCTFPVYSNKTLRLELFASPTSLHFSVYLS